MPVVPVLCLDQCGLESCAASVAAAVVTGILVAAAGAAAVVAVVDVVLVHLGYHIYGDDTG